MVDLFRWLQCKQKGIDSQFSILVHSQFCNWVADVRRVLVPEKSFFVDFGFIREPYCDTSCDMVYLVGWFSAYDRLVLFLDESLSVLLDGDEPLTARVRGQALLEAYDSCRAYLSQVGIKVRTHSCWQHFGVEGPKESKNVLRPQWWPA